VKSNRRLFVFFFVVISSILLTHPQQTRGERFAQDENNLIGYSVNGQPIELLKYGSGEDIIVFVGGLHQGFAPASVEIMEHLRSAMENLGDGLADNLTIYLIPSLNPDSPYSPGNLEGRLNANSVDLNRNADCQWRTDGTWRGELIAGVGGPAPFSEPELLLLRNFLLDSKPVATIIYGARANDGLVAPGNCGERLESAEILTNVYADSIGYRKPDFDEITTDILQGDVTNWLSREGLASIAVILPDYNDADWAKNRRAVTQILNHFGDTTIQETQLMMSLESGAALDDLLGHWEGVLLFGGEGGRREFLVTIDVTTSCTDSAYCLLYNVPGQPQLSNREMAWDTERQQYYEGSYCFSYFQDDGTGFRFPLTTLCLTPAGENQIEVDGEEPLTGISGQMTREPFSCAKVFDISQPACEALVALFQSTDGPNWNNNAGWLVNNQACTWYGINCQIVTGSLTHVMLDNNGLTGTLPPEIGNLSLSWLVLSNNEIGGELPGSIGNLQVENLVVNNTFLTGPLPLSMVNLTTLQTFDFSGTTLCIPSDESIQNWLSSVALFISSGRNCDDPYPDPEVLEALPLLLAEKNELIAYLSAPVALDREDPMLQLIIQEFAPGWGYNETRAQDMVKRIEGSFVWYEAGQLDKAGNADFEAEVEAFGRLVLTERSAKAFYPLAYETSYDIAGTLTDFMGIGLGTISALKSQPPLPDNNPFSEAALRLKARLYSRILSSLNSTWEILLNTIEDDSLRGRFQELREGVFRTVQLRLDAGQTIEEIILDEGLQRAFALALTSHYLAATQDVLTEAADGIPIAAPGRPNVTGSFIKAEGYNDHLNFVVTEETNRVHDVHERFENGSNVLDVASDISSLMNGTFIGGWTFAISTAMNSYLEGYKAYCGFSHYGYLTTSLSWAKQYAFDAEEILLDTVPEADHCRPFEWWPDWLSMTNDRAMLAKGTLLQNESEDDVYLSEDLLTAIKAFQEAISNLTLSDNPSPEIFLPALEMYLEADTRLNIQLELLEESITPAELENPQLYQLYQMGRSLSNESITYTMGLLAYLYEPENKELREQLVDEGSDIVNLAESFQEEIAVANNIPKQTFSGDPRIVDITFPADPVVGQETSGTIVIFNPGQQIMDIKLTTSGDVNLILIMPSEALTVPPGYSEHTDIQIRGMRAGLNLIQVQLMQGEKLLDVSTIAVEMSADTEEPVSEEISLISMPTEASPVQDLVSSRADSSSSWIYIILGIGVFSILVIGGLLFVRLQRNKIGG